MEINLLAEFIKANTKNIILNSDKCVKIDLIIGGGAFNGAYGYGIILFLKQLERENKIKINKISGCSVGSILAVILLGNDEINMEKEYINLQKHLKEKGNLKYVKKFINKIVSNIIKNDTDIALINDRLYITKTNVETGEQEVVSTYKNKRDVVNTIMSSCFIPYLTNGKKRYKNKYIDGITPYLFKSKKNKILFINLAPINMLKTMIVTGDGCDPKTRIIEGLIDSQNFFHNNKSRMCSWVDEWKIHDFFIYRLAHLIIKFNLLIMDYFDINSLPYIISNHWLYKILYNSITILCKDILFTIS